MTVELTKHAVKRVRQRLGLPKKAVEKLVSEAWEKGAHRNQFSGSMRRYLDWVCRERDGADNATLRIYDRFVFVFRSNALITAFLLPNHLRNRKAVMNLEDAQKRTDATPAEERQAILLLQAFKKWAATPDDLGKAKNAVVEGVPESISGRHLVTIEGDFDLVEVGRLMKAMETAG